MTDLPREPVRSPLPRLESLADRFRIWDWLARDELRRHAPPIAAALTRSLGAVVHPASTRLHLRMLMASQRFSPARSKAIALRRSLRGNRDHLLDLMPDDIPFEQAANRSIVLAPPREEAGRLIPGVLLVKFTETLRYFAHHVDIDSLQDHFRLVIEPSWAGYAVPEILFFHYARDPVVIEAAEVTDRELLLSLDGALVPIAMGSGEWVDHTVFRPVDRPRIYGAAYVANYTPAKRVPVFLRAVRDIKRAGHDFRVALICAQWGEKRETVLRFIDWYDIADSVDLYESLSQNALNDVLNQSCCNVLMSLKEGSNRSLFEAMFAGVPGLVLAENVGVNKELFTPASGVVTPERELDQALLATSLGIDRFSPRTWAMENISPEASTRKLEETLAGLFGEDEMSDPLRVKVNTPEATYFDANLRPVRGPVGRAVLSHLRADRTRAQRGEILEAVQPLREAPH